MHMNMKMDYTNIAWKYQTSRRSVPRPVPKLKQTNDARTGPVLD